MLAPGVHCLEFETVDEVEDGSGIAIWVSLTDGGTATMVLSFDEIERRAFQVCESAHAPRGLALQ